MDSDLISRSDLLTRMCQENCGERQCVDAMDRCVWYYCIKQQPTVDAAPVVQGEWELEVHKEPNCHWSVTAECSNCHHKRGKIWSANFPGFSEELASGFSLHYASHEKIDNYCPNCGADMRGRSNE